MAIHVQKLNLNVDEMTKGACQRFLAGCCPEQDMDILLEEGKFSDLSYQEWRLLVLRFMVEGSLD